MDNNRFDAMTAAISMASSRRGVMSALLGGTLALAGIDTLAKNLGAEAKKGDGDPCDDDTDCGRGLTCEKIKDKNGKKKRECEYVDGCGKKDDYCQAKGDCCNKFTCNMDRNRCEK